MLREIVLDTETTGLDPAASHKIVEVACVELINHVRTGNYFHRYINPERDVPEEAFQVHGLSTDFLQSHPIFRDIADDFLSFIDGCRLVIHNAAFDLKFLNYELNAVGLPTLQAHPVIDTLKLARQNLPGAQASLDALCRRFKIDLSKRTKHGALLDAELLSDVYLELIGGRQPGLGFSSQQTTTTHMEQAFPKKIRPHRVFPVSDEEKQRHSMLVDVLDQALWRHTS